MISTHLGAISVPNIKLIMNHKLPALQISGKILMAKKRPEATHGPWRRPGDDLAIAFRNLEVRDGWATETDCRQVMNQDDDRIAMNYACRLYLQQSISF